MIIYFIYYIFNALIVSENRNNCVCKKVECARELEKKGRTIAPIFEYDKSPDPAISLTPQ
jgi:hypothetical protein